MHSTPPAIEGAFDALAPDYDAEFTQHLIARWLRARTHALLLDHLDADSDVLELGCGTGIDARTLAPHVRSWLATDSSTGMLRTAAARLSGLANVRVEALNLNALPQVSDQRFSVVLANFGVLNCVKNPERLGAWLAHHMWPWGVVCLCVMGRFCIGETVWHLAHGNLETATRRWSGRSTFTSETGTIDVTYPAPLSVANAFAPHFELICRLPLGFALPPSDAYGAFERHPCLVRILERIEAVLASQQSLAPFADHYWIELRRLPA